MQSRAVPLGRSAVTPHRGAVRADLEEVFLSFSRSAVPAAEAPGWLAVAAGPPAAG